MGCSLCLFPSHSIQNKVFDCVQNLQILYHATRLLTKFTRLIKEPAFLRALVFFIISFVLFYLGENVATSPRGEKLVVATPFTEPPVNDLVPVPTVNNCPAGSYPTG